MNKSKGTIRLRLPLADIISLEGVDEANHISSHVIIRGMKWRAKAYSHIDEGQRYLHIALNCSAPTRYEDFDWATQIDATFKIHQVDDAGNVFRSKSLHSKIFSSNSPH